MIGNTGCRTARESEVEESLGNLRRGQKVDGDCHEANYVSHLHKSPRTELRAERQVRSQEEEVLACLTKELIKFWLILSLDIHTLLRIHRVEQ